MNLYICYQTSIITVEKYEEQQSGFCIVENYDYAYKTALPKFNFKELNIEPFYALPCDDLPRKRYFGIGNRPSNKGMSEYDYEYGFLPQTENKVLEIRERFYLAETCEIVWIRIHGASGAVPEGYLLCGYDITYIPDLEGAFSIINDCMFICKWHGCDENGTEFLDYFNKLNENGLFNQVDTALSYLKHYLGFDWSERGEYIICEIYRKIDKRVFQ